MKTILKFSLIPLLLHALTSQAAPIVTDVARGGTAIHSLFLKSDGSLWAMGDNQYGELGEGTITDSPFYYTNSIYYNWPQRPEQIVASNVTAIAAGEYHSLFLKSDGSLWAMGDNGDAQLGDGTSDDGYYYTNRPEQIVASNVTAIAAGQWHSLFLKSDGSLWAMGDNTFGQLGDGSNTLSERPEQIVASNVTAIAAGQYHSLFLKSDGSLWAMGDDTYGQLGDGTNEGGSYTNRPEQIVANGVTAIAAGESHSLFLKSGGSLWAMGLNSGGQLGDGTYNNTNLPEQIVASNVTTIAGGGEQSLFVKSDGSLWAMGLGYNGEVGNGTDLDAKQPEQIVSSDVTAIAGGLWHSLFVKSDGSLWAMGNNEYGQLGDGFLDNIYFPGVDTPEQIVPLPQPVMNIALSSQTNVQVNATCGFGGNYTLLGSANLALPASQWMPIVTNSVTTRGTNDFSVILTNAVNSGNQGFYILESP
jgi:alpha-tubulin suppressor-like RCC1 family protein